MTLFHQLILENHQNWEHIVKQLKSLPMINYHYNISYINGQNPAQIVSSMGTNAFQTTKSKAPTFTENLQQRRERTRQRQLQQEYEAREMARQERAQKEILRLKALEAAQACGAY